MASILRQHVLVPIDFSDISMEAVRAAARLALGETEITLLHVVDPQVVIPIPTMDFYPTRNLISDNMKAHLMTKLQMISDKELKRIKKVNFRILLDPDPAREICRYAEKNDVRLIVLTTHGRTGLSHMIIGSVAEKVIRLAPCPVLVMRPYKKHVDKKRRTKRTLEAASA